MIESLLMVSALAQPPADAGHRDNRASRQTQSVVGRAIRNKNAGYINRRWYGCAGFVSWAFSPYKKLPTYSGSMWYRGKKVSRKNLKPGDILLYGHKGTQHASIYIGHGKQIGANNHSAGVQIDKINSPWWRSSYAGARRVL